MKGYTENKKGLIFYIMFITLLFMCLTFFYKSEFLTEWDRYSEVIPIGKIIQIQHGESANGNFMGIYTEKWGDEENYTIFLEDKDISQMEFMSYPKQIGVQGTIFGYINKLLYLFHIRASSRLKVIYLMNITFTCLICAVLICCIREEFGRYAATGCVIIMLPMYNFYRGIHNLYWVFGVRLLPMAITSILILLYKKNNKWKRRYYVFIFLSMLFCLCHTFEFVSTEMVMCVLPIVICFAGSKKKEDIIILIKSGMNCILAFIAAIGVWFIQSWHLYGNRVEAMHRIWQVFGSRSGLYAMEGDKVSELSKSLSVYDVVSRFLFGDASYICGPIKTIYLVILAVIICIIKFIFCIMKKKGSIDFKMLSFVIISMFASVSWMIISKGHSYWHTHITILLWYFCFVPSLGAYMGKAIEDILIIMKSR